MATTEAKEIDIVCGAGRLKLIKSALLDNVGTLGEFGDVNGNYYSTNEIIKIVNIEELDKAETMDALINDIVVAIEESDLELTPDINLHDYIKEDLQTSAGRLSLISMLIDISKGDINNDY